MYKKRKKSRRFDNGGMTNDDGDIIPTQQDSINANLVQDFIGSPYESKMRAILGTAPADNSDLYDSRLEEVFASNKKVGPLTPEERARMNALAEQRIKDLESKNFGMGGTVDNSNQPDSLTNYIKGHDNNNDMKKNKKYGMGGINNPNDNNFSQQDSTDVYNYRQMREFMGEDPVRANERRGIDFSNPDLQKNLKRIKELNLDMGDLGDFKPKKKGGMVGKSKGGHRDQFTNQYD